MVLLKSGLLVMEKEAFADQKPSYSPSAEIRDDSLILV
jgi:hypothetical protein